MTPSDNCLPAEDISERMRKKSGKISSFGSRRNQEMESDRIDVGDGCGSVARSDRDDGRRCEEDEGILDAPPRKKSRLEGPPTALSQPAQGHGRGGHPPPSQENRIAAAEARAELAAAAAAAALSSSGKFKDDLYSEDIDSDLKFSQSRRALCDSGTRWTDCVLPELMGTISSFLDLPSARSLLTTLPDIASVSIVRVAYMRRNFGYLALSLEMEYGRCLDNLRVWMDVNRDWRDLYGDKAWPTLRQAAPRITIAAPTSSSSPAHGNGGAETQEEDGNRQPEEASAQAMEGAERLRAGVESETAAAASMLSSSTSTSGVTTNQRVRDGSRAALVSRREALLRRVAEVEGEIAETEAEIADTRERIAVTEARIADAEARIVNRERDIFDRVFADLTVAVRLGLVDVVRHLVENRGGNVNERIRIVGAGGGGREGGGGGGGGGNIGNGADGNAPVNGNNANNINGEGGAEGDNNAEADARRREERVRRPLLYALFLPDPSMLRYLLSVSGLEVNFTVLDSTYGCTVLHLAAVGDDVRPGHLHLLLGHNGVDADVRDNRGRTPLHYVCHFGPEGGAERVRHLLDSGANPRARDGFGRTPLVVLRRAAGEDRRVTGRATEPSMFSGGCEGERRRRAARRDMAALLRQAGCAED